ncbi:MAG: HDOD domain-containing protein [Gammaproteobacteria bacterium]|nr:HDOD domain-containing protein [Gammaproteobacteria bacterium]
MATEGNYQAPELIKKLEAFQLPIVSDMTELQSVLSDPDSATGDIVRFAAFDPVLGLYVQKLAGERQVGRTGEIHGFEHALSMIGTEGLKELIKQLPKSSEELSPEYKQVIAESVFACEIAKNLAEFKSTSNKEIIASSLFARATEWMMYWIHPRRSWQLRRMFYRRPFNTDAVTELLFDFKYSDLQSLISEQFYLPNLNARIARFNLVGVVRQVLSAVALFRQKDLRLEDCSRELRLQLGAAEMTPIIANRLAQACCSPWLRNRGRWFDIAAIHCHQPVKVIEQAVLKSLMKVVDSPIEFAQFPPFTSLVCQTSAAPYPDYLANKAQVKLKQQQQRAQAEEQARLAKERAKPPEYAPYSTSQRAQVMSHYRKLVDHPEKFRSAKQAIIETLDMLVEQTPLERVSFLALNPARTFAKSLVTRGKQKEHEKFEIKADLMKVMSWKKFIDKQAFLMFEKRRHAKYWEQQPVQIQTSDITFFLLNSLSYNGEVRAFLYADMAGSNKALSPECLTDFKRIVSGLSGRLRVN